MNFYEQLLAKQAYGAKVQEMLNLRYRRGSLTKESLIFWAEKLIDADRYTQYRGHWNAWEIGAVSKNVKTKLGQAFIRGDVTLIEKRPLFYLTHSVAAFSFRNSVDTGF